MKSLTLSMNMSMSQKSLLMARSSLLSLMTHALSKALQGWSKEHLKASPKCATWHGQTLMESLPNHGTMLLS